MLNVSRDIKVSNSNSKIPARHPSNPTCYDRATCVTLFWDGLSSRKPPHPPKVPACRHRIAHPVREAAGEDVEPSGQQAEEGTVGCRGRQPASLLGTAAFWSQTLGKL